MLHMSFMEIVNIEYR